MADYRGAASEAKRAMVLIRKREKEKEEMEMKKQRITDVSFSSQRLSQQIL